MSKKSFKMLIMTTSLKCREPKVRKTSLNLMMNNSLNPTGFFSRVEGNGSRNKYIVSLDNMLSDTVIQLRIECALPPGPKMHRAPRIHAIQGIWIYYIKGNDKEIGDIDVCGEHLTELCQRALVSHKACYLLSAGMRLLIGKKTTILLNQMEGQNYHRWCVEMRRLNLGA